MTLFVEPTLYERGYNEGWETYFNGDGPNNPYSVFDMDCLQELIDGWIAGWNTASLSANPSL
jgi:hypothetical protein